MSEKELDQLNDWVITKALGWTPCREEDYPYRAAYSRGDETCLAGDMPLYPTDADADMELLTHCMRHLDRLTGRTDFQIVVLYDEGSDNPYCVTTNSAKDGDDAI